MDSTYPLPDAKLPQVHLNSSAIENWKSETREIVQSIVNNRNSWFFRFQDFQYLYKPVYAKNNTHGYMRILKPLKMMEFMSHGVLDMTLDELAYSLHCTNNTEQCAVYAQLYQRSCLDGALLQLFEDRTPTDPFHSVAVKWIALRSPLNKILHTRDFVYFEYCFTTTDAFGRKVLIEFKKSKRFRPDQLQDHDLDITRGSMFMLNMYYMENGRVVMRSLDQHSVSGTIPVWLAASVMPIAFERVNNHHGLVYARTLVDAGMTATSLAERRSGYAIACRVCGNMFKLTRSKKWCRGCGHAVCRDCVTDVIMYNNEITSDSHLPFTREPFCLLCRFYMREQVKPMNQSSKLDQSSSRSSFTPDVEVSKLELSHISAAVLSIDDLLDRKGPDPMDESMLSLSMAALTEDRQKPIQSRRTTRSNSMSYTKSDFFSGSEASTSMYSDSLELIGMARVAADQATLLRCMYQQECQRRQQ